MLQKEKWTKKKTHTHNVRNASYTQQNPNDSKGRIVLDMTISHNHKIFQAFAIVTLLLRCSCHHRFEDLYFFSIRFLFHHEFSWFDFRNVIPFVWIWRYRRKSEENFHRISHKSKIYNFRYWLIIKQWKKRWRWNKRKKNLRGEREKCVLGGQQLKIGHHSTSQLTSQYTYTAYINMNYSYKYELDCVWCENWCYKYNASRATGRSKNGFNQKFLFSVFFACIHSVFPLFPFDFHFDRIFCCFCVFGKNVLFWILCCKNDSPFNMRITDVLMYVNNINASNKTT